MAKKLRNVKRSPMLYVGFSKPPVDPMVADATVRVLAKKARRAGVNPRAFMRHNYFSAPGPKVDTSRFGRNFFSARTGFGEAAGAVGATPTGASASGAAPAGAKTSWWSDLATTAKSLLPTVQSYLQKKQAGKASKGGKSQAAAPSMPSYTPPPPQKKDLPGWLWPVLIGGGGLAIAVVLLSRRK